MKNAQERKIHIDKNFKIGQKLFQGLNDKVIFVHSAILITEDENGTITLWRNPSSCFVYPDCGVNFLDENGEMLYTHLTRIGKGEDVKRKKSKKKKEEKRKTRNFWVGSIY